MISTPCFLSACRLRVGDEGDVRVRRVELRETGAPDLAMVGDDQRSV